MKRKIIALWMVIFAISLALAPGCGEDVPWENRRPTGPTTPTTPTGGSWPSGQLAIDYDSSLTIVQYNTANGKTTLLVQFVVRDADGFPGDTSEYRLQMFIDDRQIDVEAVPDSSVQQLETNILLALVLDASYSMVYPSSTPFDTMLNLAYSTVALGTEEWERRPGKFRWNLSWFNEVISWPAATWLPEDILTIPKPSPGASTKLYAAARAMAKTMKHQYDLGIADGPRDRHVMLLFTDGADNYSWFDNSSYADTGTTLQGKRFAQSGYPESSLNDLTDAISVHPALTVHTGGLGNNVNQQDLKDIATAGNGLFVFSPKTADLPQFFGRVLRELTTVQTRQLLIPLQKGDYTFKLVVTARNNSANKATTQFRFHTGDNTAGVM